MSMKNLTPIKLNSKNFTFTDNVFVIECSVLEHLADKISMHPFRFSLMNPISIISNKTGNIVDFEYFDDVKFENEIQYIIYKPTEKSKRINPSVEALSLHIFNT